MQADPRMRLDVERVLGVEAARVLERRAGLQRLEREGSITQSAQRSRQRTGDIGIPHAGAGAETDALQALRSRTPQP